MLFNKKLQRRRRIIPILDEQNQRTNDTDLEQKNEQSPSSLLLLDEHEQDDILQEIYQEYIQNQQRMVSIFTILCYIATVVSFGITLYFSITPTTIRPNDHHSPTTTAATTTTTFVLRWLHTICTMVVHWHTPSCIIGIAVPRPKKKNCHHTAEHTMDDHHRLPSVVSSVGIQKMYVPFVVLVWMMGIIAIWTASRRTKNTRSVHLHYGLLLSNAVLFVSAVLLRRDHDSFMASFHDLKKSKYSFKSL
jgi:magnesium-transporting ATPase (P-type)